MDAVSTPNLESVARCLTVIAGAMVFLLVVTAPIQAYAATIGVFNGRFNTAVAGLLESKLASLGEKAAITSTLTAMGTRSAAVIGACAGTGPLTPACAIGGGIVTAGVTCAAMWESGCRQLLEVAYDGTIKWLFSSDGKVEPSGTSMNPTTTKVGSNYVSTATTAPGNGSYAAYVTALAPSSSAAYSTSNGTAVMLATVSFVKLTSPSAVEGDAVKQALVSSMSGYSWSCCYAGTGGYYGLWTKSLTLTQWNTLFTAPTGARTVAQAIVDTPDSVKEKPVANDALAAATNSLWKAAAAADSSAAAWTQARAITASDVAAWRAANPTKVPTVEDFLRDLRDTGGTITFPQSQAGTSTGTETGTGTGTQTIQIQWPQSSTWMRHGEKGDIPTIEPEIQAAKSEMSSKFQEIKTQAQSILGLNLGGGGSLPSYRTTILGREFVIDFSSYDSSLGLIAAALVFGSFLAAFFIAIG